MKRIRIFISVAFLLVTLSGCGTQKTQSNDNQKDTTTTTTTTTDNQKNTNKDAKDSN